MNPAALIQLRPVDLHPPPDTTGMDEQATLERHLRHVGKRDREPQVPPHAPEDDVSRIMTPFEGIQRSNRHVSPYQIPTPNFATIPNGRTTHAVVEAPGALP